MREKPEILAPAASMDSLKSAVRAGCDAVYMGGSCFSARAYADNPEGEGLTRAIEYCHLHGVKLYLAVNTLLKDREMQSELYSFLLPPYQAGVDAVIVQDMGVLRMLHRCFPDLPLHASTQMSLTMGKGLERLQKYGVSRIVPARELSLQELQQMRGDTDLELEVFVHGALCYCYSGKCLFSSMQGGRSGNRGRCAGPCRMPYQGLGEAGYYLSLKELCNLPYIAELTEAGVDSFKIEGRMKQPEYTAFVTAVYRKYVDLCYAMGLAKFRQWRLEHREQWQEDMRKLAELYNRGGFTQGYLEGNAHSAGKSVSGDTGNGRKEKRQGVSMLSGKRPGHGGVKVGTVTAVNARHASYCLERDIMPQDVLEFRNAEEQTVYEYTAGEKRKAGQTVYARYQKGCRIHVGDSVYRTRHQILLDEIREQYLGEKKLEIYGCFRAKAGETCNLVLERGECRISMDGEMVSAAEKQAADPASVRRALCQTGDSVFLFQSLDIDLQGNVFLPVGMLKKLRRAALQELERQIISGSYRQTEKLSCAETEGASETAGNTLDISVSVMNLGQLKAALDFTEAAEIILRMDQMKDRELKEGVRLVQNSGKRAVIGMPYIWRTAAWRQHEQEFAECRGIFAEVPADGYLIHNPESFAFLREVVGVDAEKIIADADLYVMNEEAFGWWQEQGVCLMTAPWELTGKECGKLSYRNHLQFVVYGHIPLMVSAQCLHYNLYQSATPCRENKKNILYFRDGRGRKFFAMNLCRYCYNVIYQEKAYCVLDRKEEIESMGFQALRYEFTIETEEQLREILSGQMPVACEQGHWEQGVW